MEKYDGLRRKVKDFIVREKTQFKITSAAEEYDKLRQKVVESLGFEEAERIERAAKEYAAKFRKKFIYKLTPLATEATLKNYFFAEEPGGFIRGEDMGWAHKVNWQTRTIEFCDPEYAQKYEENCGGLKAFLGDLIEAGLVAQEEETKKEIYALAGLKGKKK